MRFKKTLIGYLWLGLIFALFMILVNIIAGLVLVPLGMGLHSIETPRIIMLVVAIVAGLFVLGISLHWFVTKNQFDRGRTKWF